MTTMQNINFETIDATMLAAVAGGGFNWGSFSNDVRKGIITGTVGGAVGGGIVGAATTGGPGVVPGALAGGLGGGVGGGVTAGLDNAGRQFGWWK
jgi:hypothetical protein